MESELLSIQFTYTNWIDEDEKLKEYILQKARQELAMAAFDKYFDIDMRIDSVSYDRMVRCVAVPKFRRQYTIPALPFWEDKICYKCQERESKSKKYKLVMDGPRKYNFEEESDGLDKEKET